MPLFKSLRSKSSRKSSASVASEVESTTDFGPRSTSSTTYGSVRSTKGATDYRSDSRRSLPKVSSSAPSSPPSLPRYTSSPSVRYENNDGANGDSLMGAVTPSSSAGADIASDKPRPSDLFAGKGVQWDAVKLAGPGPKSPAANTSNSEEMQNFLKM
jgi:hypothetical protein